MEQIKKLLGSNFTPEVEKAIMAEIDSQFEAAVSADGGAKYVSSTRYKAIKEERDLLKNDITARDKQIETLKPLAAGSEALTKKIEELQAKNEATVKDYEGKIKQTSRNAAIDIALSKHKPIDIKALKAVLDMEKIQLDDKENITGLDEQITALKADALKKNLFIVESNVPNGTGAKANPGNFTQGEHKEPPKFF